MSTPDNRDPQPAPDSRLVPLDPAVLHQEVRRLSAALEAIASAAQGAIDAPTAGPLDKVWVLETALRGLGYDIPDGYEGDGVPFASSVVRTPQPAPGTDPDCTVCAQVGGPHGVPQPAPELADAVAKSDRLEGQNEDLRAALDNVSAVLDRQALTYAERISRAQTLIRTAREGK